MSARARARVVALLVSLVLVVSVSPAGGQSTPGKAVGGGGWGFNNAEECLMHKINKARARHGLRRLDWDRQVGDVARRHARSMAANYSVFHDYDMDREITHWKKLGQNSGAGDNCKSLFWAFMKSSSHRSNIFGTWKHMGVGVEKRSGRLFSQMVFEWRYDPGNVYRYP